MTLFAPITDAICNEHVIALSWPGGRVVDRPVRCRLSAQGLLRIGFAGGARVELDTREVGAG